MKKIEHHALKVDTELFAIKDRSFLVTYP